MLRPTTLFAPLTVAAVLAISGCAATVNTTPSAQTPALRAPAVPTTKLAVFITGPAQIRAATDWQVFRSEWRTAFDSAATAAGLSFAYFDAEPPNQPAGTTLVKISVNDYRYLSSGARYGFGAMTGNAFVNAEAEFIEMPSKRRLGSRTYSTSSTAWQGIFSAMTAKQVAALSTEIVQDLPKK